MLDISFGSQNAEGEEDGQQPAQPVRKAYFKDELLKVDGLEQVAADKVVLV